MHEASIAQSIVQTVLREAEKQNAVRVESVEIEIGDLTFFGIDQVAFWVETGFAETIAEKANVVFKRVKGTVLCKECGYEGNIKIEEDPAYHLNLPTFACPKCGSTKIEITQGREALIRRIKILKN